MSMYGQVYIRGLRAYVPMHEGSNCCGRRLWDRAVSMLYDWKTCLALGGALKARSEERSLVNAKRSWWEVRIGLGGPFGLIGRLRHRDRRRPRRGHRAVRQGQRRPPSGRSEVRQIRTGTRLSGPRPKVALGRGFFYVGEGGPLGRGTAGRLACRIGRVAVLAMAGRNIARRAFGNGRARHLVRPTRRPEPGSRYMQRGPASLQGLRGGDGLRGPLCIRRPRLSCGLLLWEVR